VALAALLLVGRPLVRRLSVEIQPAASGALAAVGGPGGTLPQPPVGAPAQLAQGAAEEGYVKVDMVEGQVRAASLQRVGDLVDRHPEETLAVIRRWLAPEEPRA
jgi:flagellar M-ring protein FliF